MSDAPGRQRRVTALLTTTAFASCARRSACSQRSSSTICAARWPRRSATSACCARSSAAISRSRSKSYLDDTELLLGKALGLVATILDVDELEDGMLRAQLSPVRLFELIERARQGNRAHFEVRQLRCDIDVDPEMTRAARSRPVRARDREHARQRDALRTARWPLRDLGEARRERRSRSRSATTGRRCRPPIASRSSAATSRSSAVARPRARTAASACTSASSRSRRTAARSTSRSAAISAPCSSRAFLDDRDDVGAALPVAADRDDRDGDLGGRRHRARGRARVEAAADPAICSTRWSRRHWSCRRPCSAITCLVSLGPHSLIGRAWHTVVRRRHRVHVHRRGDRGDGRLAAAGRRRGARRPGRRRAQPDRRGAHARRVAGARARDRHAAACRRPASSPARCSGSRARSATTA